MATYFHIKVPTINSTINSKCPCCLHVQERWHDNSPCMNCYNGIKMEKRCIRCGIPGCPVYNSKHDHPDDEIRKIKEIREIEKKEEIKKELAGI